MLHGQVELPFPTIGYPYPLIKAHENAALTGIEMEYLASLLKNEILGTIS